MGRGREFSHCIVCRRNHQQGKGHRYTAGHKKALDALLEKAERKIAAIRTALERPQPCPQDRRGFWCSFCEEDIVDDGVFAWSNAIYHIASFKHLCNVKKFWHEQGADASRRRLYCFTDKELDKWEAECNQIGLAANSKGSEGIDNIHDGHVVSCSSVQPLLADQTTQVVRNGDVLVCDAISGSIPLGYANAQPLQPGEGNVHTGAPPPWLTDMSNGVTEDGISKTAKRRNDQNARKLEKRVGAAWANKRRAELEREKSCGTIASSKPNWLPSFGGVWQSGTRSEARKEFEYENTTLVLANARDELPATKVEPYVGKRKRMAQEASGNSVV